MIATWMVYSIVIGLLIGTAALVAERAARALGQPIRVLWAAACVATLLWPAVAYVIVSHRSATTIGTRAIAGDPTIPVLSPMVTRIGLSRFSLRPAISALGARLATTQSRASSLDRPLLVAWALCSLLLLGRLVWGIEGLRRRQRRWSAEEVDGTPVLISPDVGPAVVGFRAMQIVVPQWLMELDESLRSMVLRHEEEHRQAGDPYLLCAAAIACVLAPWNLALRWHARRLRLAVEIDCDARVLRDNLRVDRYGALLMAIAQRRVVTLPSSAAALTEPTSQLERRIEAMTTPSRQSRVIGLLCCGVAAATIAAACAAPAPDQITNPTSSAGAVAGAMASTAGATSLRRFVALGDDSACSQARSERGLPQVIVDSLVVLELDMGTSDVYTASRGPEHIMTKVLKLPTDACLFTDSITGDGAALAKDWFSHHSEVVRDAFAHKVNSQAAGNNATPDYHVEYDVPPRVVADTELRRVRKPVPELRFMPSPSPAIRSDTANQILHGVRRRLPYYTDSEVDHAVQPADGNSAPIYPASLRLGGVEGQVLMSFVVDTSGKADMVTAAAVTATDPRFTSAVREALATYRFLPAEKHGAKVPQLVRMPFIFSLSK